MTTLCDNTDTEKPTIIREEVIVDLDLETATGRVVLQHTSVDLLLDPEKGQFCVPGSGIRIVTQPSQLVCTTIRRNHSVK